MGTPTSNHLEREELDRVLGSGIFSKAPGQAKLLKYICDQYLQGKADKIKEYTLATEVLGRPEDFDQNRDAIVRVEVHRLRKKLKEYYESDGAAHPLRIVIDPGHYVPRFVPREQMAAVELDANSGAFQSGRSPSFESHQGTLRTISAHNEPVRRRPLPVVLGGLAVVSLMGAILLVGRKRANSSVRPSPVASPTTLAGPLDSVRILAGYSQANYIDRAGSEWGPDRYYSGGGASSQPRQFIARTLDTMFYEQCRLGEFSYNIPLKPGAYELHLFFVEPEFGPGKLHGGGEASRVFNVLMNRNPLLFQFDVIRDAGTNEAADEKVFTDVHPAPDGYLHLDFLKQTDYPLINAIEILPGLPGKMHAVRIVAGENSYTDHSGHVWTPDRYFMGGRLVNHNVSIKGSADPDLYTSERFGNFNYSIPLAAGSRYMATLYFAETYFGPENPGETRVGSRLFDVYCNGTTLLRSLDIFKEAGGENRPVSKTFHGLVPNAQGKLIFNFVPVRNYACLNAIEVAPE